MILTCDVIRREIETGRVVIDPFFADQVGPASIDLHLGDLDRGRGAVDVEREDYVAAVAAQKRREFTLDDVRARRLLPASVYGDRDEALRALAARGVLAAFVAGFRFQRDVSIETHYSNSN